MICNPNVILTPINFLVAESYNISCESPHTAQSIHETGEISREVLHRICQSVGKLLPTHHIIELLKHLNLITEISSDSELEGPVYFMPCLLHHCDVESTSLESLHAMEPAPLFIHFSCGYMPAGFFNVLNIHLAEKWILEPKRYKNRVSFITNRSLIGRCVLTLHLNYLQVDVETEETNTPVLYCIVLYCIVSAPNTPFCY